MTLKCTVDGTRESEDRPIFVCHHCGRPLCEEHGWVVIADDAFDGSAEDPGRRMPTAVAYLREQARRAAERLAKQARKATVYLAGQLRIPQLTLLFPEQVPQRAMHCKQCLDENHPGTFKRHGWSEPKKGRPAAVAAAPRPASQEEQLVPEAAKPQPAQPREQESPPSQQGEAAPAPERARAWPVPRPGQAGDPP
jgi:hypothetical protein